MKKLDELWKSAEKLIIQAEYENAIIELNEIKKYSYLLRSEKIIRLKKLFIEVYAKNNEVDKAIILCSSLTIADDVKLKKWSKNKLKELENIQNKSQKKSIPNKENTCINLKSVKDFKEFARQNILTKLKYFEIDRKKTIKLVFLFTIIYFVCIYFILKDIFALLSFFLTIVKHMQYLPECYRISQFRDNIETNFFWFIVACSSFICANLVWILKLKSILLYYKKGFKKMIIKPILAFIDPQKRINYYSKIDVNHLINYNIPLIGTSIYNSQLFSKFSGNPKFQQEDCVYGTIDNVDVFWTKVCVQKIAGYDWSGIVSSLDRIITQLGITNIFLKYFIKIILFPIKISILILLIPFILTCLYLEIVTVATGKYNFFSNFGFRSKPIFNGLFFEADFHKSFQGQTLVATKNINLLVHNFWKEDSKDVKLEDPEFNRIYQVQSYNQVEARYILSTKLMSTLVDFYKTVKRPIRISFNKSKIYIAITYDYDPFEPKLFKSMLAFAPLKEYFETLQFMIRVTQELNLNRKIWGNMNDRSK